MNKNECKELAKRVFADTGGAFTVALGYIGTRLGLFKAMSDSKPVSSEYLARKTGVNERYAREWLKGMVAAEYLEYDVDSDQYFMTKEQVAVLSDEKSPVFVGGSFLFTIPSILNTERIMHIFTKGGGISYSELGPEISYAMDQLHRPGYDYLLTEEWLSSVPALVSRLETGISVLDVGCGFGRSSIAIGLAYPNSRILGIDADSYSIDEAKRLAAEANVKNVTFIDEYLENISRDTKFDLVIALDCVHDFTDPVGGLKVIKDILSVDGMFFWSEPTGSQNPIENRNLAGKMRATLSTFHCLTVSLAIGGVGLGTIIGETGARELAQEAGFNNFEVLPVDNLMQQFFLLSA